MKYYLSIILILQICAASNTVLAQKNKLFLEPGHLYSQGKIYMGGEANLIYAKRIILTNDSTLNYTNPKTGLPNSIKLNKSSVSLVQVKTGTRAGELGLYGSGIGLFASVVKALQDEFSNEDIDQILGYTIGGFIVGGLIGILIPKYKDFYIRTPIKSEKVEMSPAFCYSDAIGFGITIKF